MTAFMPPVLLPVPPHQNTPRYGLFDVATGPLDLPPHAGVGGIEYITPLCTLPNGYQVACTPGSKSLTNTTSLIIGQPFVVIADLVCGTVGRTEAEFRQMAMNKLVVGEQAVVEMIFSNGAVGAAPSLANNAANLPMLTPATSIDMAIGELEGWLYARYGSVGIIHVPISAANYVYSDFHVYKDGGVWKTQNGTLVSFGNYSGNAADGTTPTTGHTTFYITGQMAIWRAPDSDVFISPYDASVNTTTNQVAMYAEREYVLAYECLGAGVDVTLVAPS
jgi:hypothetical protein